MTSPDVPAPHPDLVQALTSGTAICVIGSGLSLGGGAPSWAGLLEGVAAEAFELDSAAVPAVAQALQGIEQGRLVDAAAILEDLLGRHFKAAVARQIEKSRSIKVDKRAVDAALLGDEVTTLFSSLGKQKPRQLAPTESHRMVTRLPFRSLVTTNYDMLLEEAAPRKGVAVASYSRTHRQLSQIARSGKWFILKLHGDVENLHDIVVSPADFTSAIFDEKSGEVLRSLFQLNTPLWIGSGHQDPTLNHLIDGLRARLGLTGGFALVERDVDRQTKKRLEDAEITPLFLESYRYIPAYLRRLARATGAPVAFSVSTALRPDSVLGPRIARFFTKAIGPVDYWTTREKTVWLEADADTLDSLRDRFQRESPDAGYAFDRYGLVSFDGWQLQKKASSNTLITRREGDLAVVALVGKVTIGGGDVALREAIIQLLADGVRRLVVDSRLVSTMDSNGIGELYGAVSNVHRLGGELVLSRATGKMLDVLQITQLISVTAVFDNDEEAVTYLKAGGMRAAISKKVNELLRAFLGAGEAGGYRPGGGEERLKEAYPDSHEQMRSLIERYLEFEFSPNWDEQSLEEAGEAFTVAISERFPELEPAVARSLGHRFTYSWR